MKGYNFGCRLLEINGMAKLLILKLQQNLTRYKAFHCVINFRRKRNVLKRKVEENHQTSQTNVPIGISKTKNPKAECLVQVHTLFYFIHTI